MVQRGARSWSLWGVELSRRENPGSPGRNEEIHKRNFKREVGKYAFRWVEWKFGNSLSNSFSQRSWPLTFPSPYCPSPNFLEIWFQIKSLLSRKKLFCRRNKCMFSKEHFHRSLKVSILCRLERWVGGRWVGGRWDVQDWCLEELLSCPVAGICRQGSALASLRGTRLTLEKRHFYHQLSNVHP